MSSRRVLSHALRAYQGTVEAQAARLGAECGESWAALAGGSARGSTLRRTADLAGGARWPSTTTPGLRRSLHFTPRQQFHFAAWPHMQQHQAQKEAEPAPVPPASTSAAVHPSPPRLEPALLTEWADAEECDEAMEDLEKARKRVSALKRPPPGQVSIAQRARTLRKAVTHGVRLTLGFLAATPGAIARFAALPRAERRAALWRGDTEREIDHGRGRGRRGARRRTRALRCGAER